MENLIYRNIIIKKIIKINFRKLSMKIVIKFIFIIYIFFLIIYKSIKIRPIDREYIFKLIKKFENNLNNVTEIEIQNFRKINSRNICLDSLNYKKSDNPYISVIITIHNQAHCIHKCLRSIQNQSLKNLEIIIIDDCSLDNSTEIIEKYQNEDERIIFVKHNTNKGTIKTRCDAIRLAKGKYITIIDGDDALINKDILENSFYIANLGNLDVVEFKAYFYKDGKFDNFFNSYSVINLSNIIYKPELETKFFYTQDVDSIRAFQNRNICFKIIKNSIFKKTIRKIGKKYTEDFNINYEDTIMTFALFKIANSYYFMKYVGYYYSGDEKNNTFPFQKNKKCKLNRRQNNLLDYVKLLQFILEQSKNNKLERQMLYHEIISLYYYTGFLRLNEYNIKALYKIFDIT